MALNREEYTRIAAHISGNLTGAERESFELWQKSPDDEAAIRDLETIWENSGVRVTDPTVDTDTEWRKLAENIQRTDWDSTDSNAGHARWIRIAACLIILILAGLWLLPKEEQPTDATQNQVRLTASSSVELFYLPDSSRIWLNSGSSIAYEEGFGQTERRVHLQGEGYFEVSGDLSKPFIIEMERALVRVTGTAFNLREANDEVMLNVDEGHVRFSARDSLEQGSIIVNAGEAASVTRDAVVAKATKKSTSDNRWRLENNPSYETEKARAADYLQTKYEWRKNSLNRSVVRGVLTNNASIAVYDKIVLRVVYTNGRGRIKKTEINIPGKIRPGDSVDFEKRLLDIFRDTRSMEITVRSVSVVED